MVEYKKYFYPYRHTGGRKRMGKDLNRRKKMVKRAAGICAVLTGACLAILLGGCGKKEKEPVTVTLWHVYGGQTESPLNDLIDEFNETVGKDKNIRVEVGSVTNTNIIHEGVLAAVSYTHLRAHET